MSSPLPILAAIHGEPESPTPQSKTTGPEPTEPWVAVPRSSQRFVSLDVLRGLAILLMIFSGMIPKTLPSWMDHGYQPHFKPNADGVWVSALDPGGDAVFDGRWKAMTWVDLVFPMFLFSMGAAIPIAMSKRRERGESKASLTRSVVARFFMLMVFALLIYQLNPPQVAGQSDDARKIFLLAATGVVFLFFVRWPASVTASTQKAIRWIAGFILLAIVVSNVTQRAAMVAADPKRDGLLFHWAADTIIMVLAYSYLVAGIAWLFSRHVPWVRFAVFVPVMLIAHYIAISPKDYPDWLWMGDWPSTHVLFSTTGGAWTLRDVLQSPLLALNLPGWIGALKHACETRLWLGRALDLSPLFNFTWLKFLWIVIPGTMVGDWLVRRSQQPQVIDPDLRMIDVDHDAFPKKTLLALSIAAIALVCVGLRNYGFTTLGLGGPMKTPYFALLFGLPVVIAGAIVAIVRVPINEWLIRRLFVVGAVFASVGLVLACLPWHAANNHIFEGGISKGPPATLSYYFTATGLCMQLLGGLFGVLDASPRSARRVGLIEANGQNPMLVYFLEHIAIGSIFGLALFAPFHAAAGGDGWWSHVQSLDDLGRFADHPWLGAAWGAFKTLLIAAVVWVLTRRKIFWRA